MGIGKKIVEFESNSLRYAYLKYSQVKMCEMGNQEYKLEDRMPAKIYYEEKLRVEEHVSIDLNKMWGALGYDMTQELPSQFNNHFDLVTNYGTGEHVGDQYSFYTNCHRVCKNLGLMVHFIPHEGYWPGHGRYYFTQDSIWQMAKVFDYKILNFQNIRLHDDQELSQGFLISFIKLNERVPNREEFAEINIVDTDNSQGTGVAYV